MHSDYLPTYLIDFTKLTHDLTYSVTPIIMYYECQHILHSLYSNTLQKLSKLVEQLLIPFLKVWNCEQKQRKQTKKKHYGISSSSSSSHHIFSLKGETSRKEPVLFTNFLTTPHKLFTSVIPQNTSLQAAAPHTLGYLQICQRTPLRLEDNTVAVIKIMD